MLEVNNLEAYYGESVILKNVCLNVQQGHIVCLLGRNGVGKSTFLKSVMGLVHTPCGSICLNNEEIIDKPTYFRARAGIGYVPQGRDIFPHMTVEENLQLGLEIKGGRGGIPQELYELFPVLKEMLTRKGGDLSGGQQQQLAIARALAVHPKLLLLDEPTEGIQPSIIKDIGRVILRLKKEGYTILIVEQYLEFILGIADDYYVMDKGAIIAQGLVSAMNKEDIQHKIAI
ncbi:urea ABC transporter ATP-binding subunit UrtE [Pectinatus haikarae]|uniref:urea ABC transporter ATP-binding subunit UrtE n=1 Tax=Pectinatus haikarae TaxID=349096 RepID=UPI003D804A2C